MGWKCVPQVMGLVRSDGMRRDGKGQAKHRANAAAIVNEAFEIADQTDGHAIHIRKSASDTYDRSRTVNNRYIGPQTADAVLAALEESAAAQAVEVRTTDKETGEIVVRKRPLRSDAVIGVAVIYKPPCAIARDWSREQYDKFISDSREVMAAIQCGGEADKKTGNVKRGREPCRLFGSDNLVASAEHWDEGSEDEDPEYEGVYTGHWHDVYVPKDEDGKYRGNLIDMYFLSRVCQQYPSMMRARGWDIEDCDVTDWERWNSDPAYRAERKAKIRQGGKSTNKHIASEKRKEAAAKLAEAQDMLDQATGLKQEAIRRAEVDAASVRAQAQAEADALLADAAEDAGNAVARAQTEAKVDAAAALDMVRLEADIEAAALLAEARSESEAILTAARDAAVEAGQERMQAEAGRDKARQEAAEAEVARKAAEADRKAALQEAADAEARRMSAQMALPVLDGLRTSMLNEIKVLDQSRDKAREALDAAKAEVETAHKSRDTARTEAETAKADRDAARREADELRRNAVARAEQEAEAVRERIEANARDGWEAWLERKKKWANDTARQIIDDAEARAAEGAQGEYAFLLEWLGAKQLKSGKTLLEAARAAYAAEVHKARVSAIPEEVRNAGRGQQTGTGLTVPGK